MVPVGVCYATKVVTRVSTITTPSMAVSIPRDAVMKKLVNLTLGSGASTYFGRTGVNVATKRANLKARTRLCSTGRNVHMLRIVAASTQEGTLAALEKQLGSPLSSLPMVPPAKPHVFLICGASGVGKDAVLTRLQELRPDLYFVVTATSRAMRPGEVDGKDYFFISTGEFEKMIADGELLEHAVVYGQYKGIPKGQIRAALKENTDVVLRLDVQGAATMRKILPGIITIFLVAESERALVERLVGRQTEDLDSLKLRVETARLETARYTEFDYVLPNVTGQLDETAQMIAHIIDLQKSRANCPPIEVKTAERKEPTPAFSNKFEKKFGKSFRNFSRYSEKKKEKK